MSNKTQQASMYLRIIIVQNCELHCAAKFLLVITSDFLAATFDTSGAAGERVPKYARRCIASDRKGTRQNVWRSHAGLWLLSAEFCCAGSRVSGASPGSREHASRSRAPLGAADYRHRRSAARSQPVGHVLVRGSSGK